MRAALVSLQIRRPQARSRLICRANRYLEEKQKKKREREIMGMEGKEDEKQKLEWEGLQELMHTP